MRLNPKFSPGCKQFEYFLAERNASAVTHSNRPKPLTTISVNIDMGPSISSTKAWPMRPCSHFHHRGCSLTTTDGHCCACADRRPRSISGRYASYIDGIGWVEQGLRWAGYCPNCQDAFKQFDTLGRGALRQQGARKPTKCPIQTSKKVATSKPPRHCEHWKGRNCSMTSTRECCCSCADRRPTATSYSMYVDGSGWIKGGTRWAFYCPGCRSMQPPRSALHRCCDLAFIAS